MLGDVIARLAVMLTFDGSEFATGSSKAQQHLAKLRDGITGLDDRWRAMGRSLSKGVTLPVAGLGAGLLTVAADFETAMNTVAISTQASSSELSAMSKLATRLGADTLFGASEAAEGMDMLAKNGLTATQILGGAAKAAVDLAEAAGSELAPAADAITDVMAQFKLSTSDLGLAVNQITGAVNESKLDFDDFALAIGQSGGVAGAAGVEFRDFNAVLAGTSSLFASGSDAGTSFKTFLTSLPGKSSTARGAIETLGLRFYDAAGNLRSMAEIAQELQDKLGGLSEVARQEYLTQIFGTDAMRTAIGLMDLGAAGIERVKTAISETDAGGQAAKRMETLAGQLDNLRGAFEWLAIAIADTGILTVVTKMVSAFAGFVSRLAETNPFLLKLAVGAALLAAAMGPLMVVTGALAAVALPLFITKLSTIGILVSALINPVGTAAALLTQFAGAALLSKGLSGIFIGLRVAMLALFANPVFLGAAAAVTAVYLAWKNWDKIAPALQPLVDELHAIGEGLGLVEQKAGATQAELAKTEGWRMLGAELKTAGEQIGSVFNALDEGSRNAGLAIYEHFTKPASAAIGTFFTALETGAAQAGMAIRAFVDGAIGWINRMVGRIHQAIVGRLGATFDWLGDKLGAAGDLFFRLYDRVVGHSYVPDMVDGIAAEMKRLDSVMTAPIAAATSAGERAFRGMAANVRGLLDRLFPEVRQLLDYRGDLAAIDASGLPADQQAEARRRLGRELAGVSGTSTVTGDFGTTPIAAPDMDRVQEGLKAIGEATGRIKDGWLDLKETGADLFGELSYQLKGVIRGAQSLGDALKNVAFRLADQLLDNAFASLGRGLGIPGFANGTNFAPGGLALVGERGPELVNLPRGSRVFDNGRSMEMMGAMQGGDRRVMMNVYTPDADSFRRSERQVTRGMRRRLGE